MTPEQIKAAREALDSLDDYASMDVGVNAIGPRGVLERFISEAERTTAPVSLTDEQAWTIITEICGTQLTRVGSRKFQVVEINDMATAGEVARALLAAAPSPAVAVEPVAWTSANLLHSLKIAREVAKIPSNHSVAMRAAKRFEDDVPLYATPSPSLVVRDVVEDPMDWPLPCDVKVGRGTHRKGCTLGSLVARMQVLYNMVQAGIKAPSGECMAAMLANLDATQKPNADCSGEPPNCPDNEGYGCACDPMNKAGSVKP